MATDGHAATDGHGATDGRAATDRLAPREAPGGADQLLADVRFAALLATEARNRAMARLFGVSKDQAGIVALIVLVLASRGARDSGKRMVGPDSPVSSGDLLLAGAMGRELFSRMTGLQADSTPLLGTLLVAAVAVSATRRVMARSRRAVKSSSSRANAHFHHRYGYLIDPGHRRQHRAVRRRATAMAVATSATDASRSPTAAAVSHKTSAEVSSSQPPKLTE